MPLRKGSSKKTISKNIGELLRTKPGASRAKAISTLAKKRGISKAEAKRKQAVSIAYSKAKKSKKK